jgi:hypothetical protein
MRFLRRKKVGQSCDWPISRLRDVDSNHGWLIQSQLSYH